jgi:hypothetical protein
MEDMKIPHKLIRLVKITMKNTTARVKVTNKLSNSFTFNEGARQGDGFSTTLFILALHHGVQQTDQRGTIFTKLSHICAYADDIVIVARMQKKLTEMYLDLEDETSKLGLTFRSVIPVVYVELKQTNVHRVSVKKHNYICNIHMCINYMFRPFLVRPSSGWNIHNGDDTS